MYDVSIIGAGPAGLQAALSLGRMHRSTLLLDSGEYRNGPVAHMHNVIGNDGTSPAEFRAAARAELSAYADVEVRDTAVRSVTGRRGDFVLTLADGSSVRVRRVILATGVADELPDVPGLAELWGRRAFTCPFCDGHEHSGTHIGVLGAGARAEHLIGMLRRIAAEITVFPLGEAASADERAAIEALGARVHPHPVDAVRADGDGVLVSAGDDGIRVAGLFVAAGAIRQRAPFAEQLGVSMLPSGGIEIDEFGRTSVPGVSAAGDLAHRASLPGIVASVVMASAAGQMAAAAMVQELAAEDAAAGAS